MQIFKAYTPIKYLFCKIISHALNNNKNLFLHSAQEKAALTEYHISVLRCFQNPKPWAALKSTKQKSSELKEL